METTKKSTVFKTLIRNLRIVSNQDISDIDLKKITVTSKLVGAIQYFDLEGLNYNHCFVHNGKLCLFKNKESMVHIINNALNEMNIFVHGEFTHIELESEDD